MKTFIHSMYYLPEFGSAPILMNELASYLVSRGNSVEVVTTIPRPPHHKEFRNFLFHKELNNGFCIKRFRTNFTVHHLGRLVAWTIYTSFSIVNLLNAKRGDVVFLRLPPLQLGITGFIAKKFKGLRVFLNIQDIHPDLSIESGLLKNRIAIKLAKRFESWIYRNADEIVVISEGFKKNLEAKGVAPNKMTIIPNWVDTDFIKPLPKVNSLSQKFLFHDKFLVMYSGTITLSSYLTLERILETARLLERENNLRFVIVGEGLKKPDLEQKTKRLGLKNVTFLPFQPYPDLPFLLASSDVLIVPLDREKTQLSVPSKLYNYLAAGRPILGLTDDDSEVARIIREAECGFNAEPENVQKIAEQILSLKNSGETCDWFGRNARKYCVENFSRERVLEQYERTLASIHEIKGTLS